MKYLCIYSNITICTSVLQDSGCWIPDAASHKLPANSVCVEIWLFVRPSQRVIWDTVYVWKKTPKLAITWTISTGGILTVYKSDKGGNKCIDNPCEQLMRCFGFARKNCTLELPMWVCIWPHKTRIKERCIWCFSFPHKTASQNWEKNGIETS